jgi:hypothetical protein
MRDGAGDGSRQKQKQQLPLEIRVRVRVLGGEESCCRERGVLIYTDEDDD